MTAYTPDQAERDLSWLEAAGAVRGFERTAGIEPAFLVTTPDRREHVITPDEVRTLRLGVLIGWRLPRSSAVIG